MCLIAWSWQPDSSSPLLLLGNRDEFYARPTMPLHWWEDAQVLAGRDLHGGGTWLGVSKSGRMAALTNFRDTSNFRADAPSRGALVTQFLMGQQSALAYLEEMAKTRSDYNPFNLLVYDGEIFLALESRSDQIFSIAPGIGAVSNADIDTPWPKVEKIRSGLAQRQLQQQLDMDDALWDFLQDKEPADDLLLPQTGISLERERALSPIFIRTADYGTRSSTLLRIHAKGFTMKERTFDATGLTGHAEFSL